MVAVSVVIAVVPPVAARCWDNCQCQESQQCNGFHNSSFLHSTECR